MSYRDVYEPSGIKDYMTLELDEATIIESDYSRTYDIPSSAYLNHTGSEYCLVSCEHLDVIPIRTETFIVTIGPSHGSVTKTVTITGYSDIEGPSVLTKDNRANTHYAFDTFDIVIDGNNITATRTDSTNGWGMNLQMYCTALYVGNKRPFILSIDGVQNSWCTSNPSSSSSGSHTNPLKGSLIANVSPKYTHRFTKNTLKYKMCARPCQIKVHPYNFDSSGIISAKDMTGSFTLCFEYLSRKQVLAQELKLKPSYTSAF